MDTKDVRRLIDLDEKKAELDEALKEVKQEREALEAQLMEDMLEDEVQSMTIGGRTVFFHRQLWAGHKGDKQELCAALTANSDTADFVSPGFHSGQLSAYFREKLQDMREATPEATPEDLIATLPEALQEHLKFSETVKLQTRKA